MLKAIAHLSVSTGQACFDAQPSGQAAYFENTLRTAIVKPKNLQDNHLTPLAEISRSAPQVPQVYQPNYRSSQGASDDVNDLDAKLREGMPLILDCPI